MHSKIGPCHAKKACHQQGIYGKSESPDSIENPYMRHCGKEVMPAYEAQKQMPFTRLKSVRIKSA